MLDLAPACAQARGLPTVQSCKDSMNDMFSQGCPLLKLLLPDEGKKSLT